jgi:hypothetical protein
MSEFGRSPKINLDYTVIESDRFWTYTDEEFAVEFTAQCPLYQLQHLKLDRTKIGDLSMKAIADALTRGDVPALRQLHFSRTVVSDHGLRCLADALKRRKDQALFVLALENTKVTDNGFFVLAELIELGYLTKLISLKLGSSLVSDAGFKAVIRAAGRDGISKLPHLYCLETGSAPIGDETLVALSEVARAGGLPSLRDLCLDLRHIKATRKGFRALKGKWVKTHEGRLSAAAIIPSHIDDAACEKLAKVATRHRHSRYTQLALLR